jgi:hypothetical protein
MRNLKSVIATFGGFALALFVGGCADILQAPAAPEAKPGKVTLNVSGGPARTVAPNIAQFEKIVLSIVDSENPADMREVPVDKNSGSVTVEFQEPGSWKITAKAYINAGNTDPAAESEPHDFNWDDYGAEVNGETSFVLLPTAEASIPGTLKYTITIPGNVTLAGSGSSITIEQEGSADLELDGFTNNVLDITEDKTGAVDLPAGYYGVYILLENDEGETAIYWENAVVLPGLLTELAFEPDAEDFLDPEARAALTDINEKDGEHNKLLVFGEPLSKTGAVAITPNFSNGASPSLAIAAPAGTGTVYFTLAKTAAHSVLVKEGDDSALVAQAEKGITVKGSEAGDTLAVFTVDTASAAVAGGNVEFTLTITKEGKTGVGVAVTITVTAPQTGNGAGLYINTGTVEVESLSQDVKDQNENPAQTTLGGYLTELPDILDWLGANAVDGTKYVVLVDQDWGLDTGFTSPDVDTGVHITLRGIGEKRTISWISSSAPSVSFFAIGKNSTLTLGNDIAISSTNSVAESGIHNLRYFMFSDNATLEMRGNSEISGIIIFGSLIPLSNENRFRMYDNSTIKGNTLETPHSNNFGIVQIGAQDEFEMHNNASIAGNYWDFSGLTGNETQKSTYIISGRATAVYTTGGKFTMYNSSSISGNEMRAVYAINSGNDIACVTMEGGAITNNGKKTRLNTDNDFEYCPTGGGLYLSTGTKFEMKGGEISDNGVPGRPGSGILTATAVTEAIPYPFMLNGNVAITGNPVMIVAPNTGHRSLYLGSAFTAPSSVPVDLFITTDSLTTFASNWLDKQFLKPAGVNSITGMNQYVSLTGFWYFSASSPNASKSYNDDIHYVLDEDGYIRNSQ